jgi:molecular chaperone GrpE
MILGEGKTVIDEKKKNCTSELEGTDVKETDSQQSDLAGRETSFAEKKGEIGSYVDRLKRLQAEFENYKKRVQRETGSTEERISDREILDFLPLFDNMERAFTSYSGNNDVTSFVEGVERIFAQFDQLLKHKGVSPIEVLGQRFDPARHEALLSVESDEGENVILEEFERGYLRNGRLLRPSKVKVSKGKPKTEEETV